MSITAGQPITASDINLLNPVGAIQPYAGRTAPSGYLLCDGSAVSRTTYSQLFAILCPSFTFTVTIASPAVFTKVAHGLVEGDKVHFKTTGALPTGLAVNTDYYVIATGLTADNFRVSTTRGGSAVNTSGSQSGTHTLYISNYGKGDGSTTFNLPNLKDKTVYGYDASDDNFDVLDTPNTYVGAKTHTLTTAQIPSHAHTNEGGNAFTSSQNNGGSSVSNQIIQNTASVGTRYANTDLAGGGGSHNNMPPYSVMNYIIRSTYYS